MTEKSIKKRLFILQNAAIVFQRKGYFSVTMQDIIDQCKISRGGLYKYFGSTKEIFETILMNAKSDDTDFIQKSINQNRNSIDILKEFLKIQENTLNNIHSTLYAAVYEFYLACKNDPDYKLFNSFYLKSAESLNKLILYGKKRGEIKTDEDSDVLADHIIFLIEGLTVASISLNLKPEIIKNQLNLIIKLIK